MENLQMCRTVLYQTLNKADDKAFLYNKECGSVKYLKIEIVELPTEQAAKFESAVALATCPDFNLSDMREEVLQSICKEDSAVKAVIEQFRRENQ
jgi:hypothetical protein